MTSRNARDDGSGAGSDAFEWQDKWSVPEDVLERLGPGYGAAAVLAHGKGSRFVPIVRALYSKDHELWELSRSIERGVLTAFLSLKRPSRAPANSKAADLDADSLRRVLRREAGRAGPLLVFGSRTATLASAEARCFEGLLTGLASLSKGRTAVSRQRGRLICVLDRDCGTIRFVREPRVDARNPIVPDGLTSLVLPIRPAHELAETAIAAVKRVWNTQGEERMKVVELLRRIPTLDRESAEVQKDAARAIAWYLHVMNCHVRCPRDGQPSVPIFIQSLNRIGLQHIDPLTRDSHGIDWNGAVGGGTGIRPEDLQMRPQPRPKA